MLDDNIYNPLYGLIFECPFKDECEGCPLSERRKIPIKERMEWLDKLSDEDCDEIVRKHCHCVYTRETKNMKDGI